MFDHCASLFFCMKILSEGPYLKSFISRVLCLYRERFRSYQASVIRLPVAKYFLSSLQCNNGTKAVKVKAVYSWPGMRNDITQLIKTCDIC